MVKSGLGPRSSNNSINGLIPWLTSTWTSHSTIVTLFTSEQEECEHVGGKYRVQLDAIKMPNKTMYFPMY